MKRSLYLLYANCKLTTANCLKTADHRRQVLN